MIDRQSNENRKRSGKRKRLGGHAANTSRRGFELFKQPLWRLPVNYDPPVEPLSEDGVQAIHNGAMQILEEIGIEFLNEEALELFVKAGCKVEGTNVKMRRDWVLEMIGKAPAKFTIIPRNPENALTLSGFHSILTAFILWEVTLSSQLISTPQLVILMLDLISSH